LPLGLVFFLQFALSLCMLAAGLLISYRTISSFLVGASAGGFFNAFDKIAPKTIGGVSGQKGTLDYFQFGN